VRLMKQPIAGFDCFPPHEYPPRTICNGKLCTQWMADHAVPGECTSEHAHGNHYWGDAAIGSALYVCKGREYCDPRFAPPAAS
jgi:hypothetical protein